MKHLNKTNILKQVIIAAVIIFILCYLVRLFVKASGGYIHGQINTEIWAHFGSFMAAFLLAATLIYQIRAFHRQQVEAKFFELIKYYRANIDEMKFRNPFYYEEGGRKADEEYVSGRRVMKTVFEQYKVARKIAEELDFTEDYFFNQSRYEELKKTYLKEWDTGHEDIINEKDWLGNLKINEVAYIITFWGIPIDADKELKSYLECILCEAQLERLTGAIKQVVAVYESKNNKATYSGNLKFQSRGIFDNLDEIPKEDNISIKFFGGHQYHLGHFFRHLYQAVKYIDQQSCFVFSKSEKYDYIKTLRAQMSNYEQAVFLINSLTALGRKWEYENKYNKKLISKYHLVKNLPRYFIPNMEPHYYYPEVDFEWKNINRKKK